MSDIHSEGWYFIQQIFKLVLDDGRTVYIIYDKFKGLIGVYYDRYCTRLIETYESDKSIMSSVDWFENRGCVS